jgi:hypothetical protein
MVEKGKDEYHTPFVLLADVVLFGQVDEVGDRLGGKQVKGVDEVNLRTASTIPLTVEIGASSGTARAAHDKSEYWSKMISWLAWSLPRKPFHNN